MIVEHQLLVGRGSPRRRSISSQQLLVLVDDLLALEAGQPLQAHVEDRLGLDLGEAEARDQAAPWPRRGVWLARISGDHLVEVVERDLEQPSRMWARSSALRRS